MGDIQDIVWKDRYNHFQCIVSATIREGILHIVDRQGDTSLTNAICKRFIDDISSFFDEDFEEIFLYHPDRIHTTWDEKNKFNCLDGEKLNKYGFDEFINIAYKEGYDLRN